MAHHLQGTASPGPHVPLHQVPCPAETWGRRPDHPTRLLRRIQSSAGWDNLCTPGPTAYLWYTRLRTPGGGLCAPHSGLQGLGRAWPQGRSEQQNPVGRGAGGGERGPGGRGGEGGRGGAEGGAEQAGLLRGGGASVEERGTQLPHPHLRSSEPCPAASALPVGLGGLGWRPDAEARPSESQPPTGLLVLGRPWALTWASEHAGPPPRPRGRGQWAFQQLKQQVVLQEGVCARQGRGKRERTRANVWLL